MNDHTRIEIVLFNPLPTRQPLPILARERATKLGLCVEWTPTRGWFLDCNLTSKYDPITLSRCTAWGVGRAAQFAGALQ